MNINEEFSNLKTIMIPLPIVKVKPLKSVWLDIYEPLVNLLDLEVRMNLRNPSIDIRSDNDLNLERAKLFINAILKGFKPADSLLALKDENVSIVTFKISDVKHLSKNSKERAIGRIIGTDGKMKNTIEDTTKCKILINDESITIFGLIDDIKNAKDSICRLIMGSKPNTISNRLKLISSKKRIASSIIYTVPYNKDRLI